MRHSDSSEALYLHMGYFATLTAAVTCAQIMRAKYPDVIVTPVPSAHDSVSSASASGNQKSLSDTQVLNVLETRRAFGAQDSAIEAGSAQISLVRPEDTAVLRSLREAVAQRAPVAFAVQLQWSAQPIDPGTLPSNSIFRVYTLYATQGVNNGRPGHYLRLGFFTDATSAKQVAYYVRADFPAVAVVPVVEQERERADAERIDPATLTDPFQQHLDRVLDTKTAKAPAAAAPVSPAPQQAARASFTPPPRAPARERTELDETLDMLASSETWNDDSLSETGVRHLTVTIQKRPARS
jgi:hypothetical protein